MAHYGLRWRHTLLTIGRQVGRGVHLVGTQCSTLRKAKLWQRIVSKKVTLPEMRSPPQPLICAKRAAGSRSMHAGSSVKTCDLGANALNFNMGLTKVPGALVKRYIALVVNLWELVFIGLTIQIFYANRQ